MRLLIVIGLANCPALSAAEENASFDIIEYRVEGNSVLAANKIEEVVYPFMGDAKNIDTVEQARAALEKAYHDSGYLTVFVSIPEQKIDQNTVRLRVQEGRVERLRVVGSRYYSLGVIKSRVPEFAEGSVPYFPAVQTQLASVNTTADRRVTPVLRAGKSPGKVEVDLKVQDQLPLHGDIAVHNRYSSNTTHSRLEGSMRYANLWQRDHSLSLSLQTTPEKTAETKVAALTYLVPDEGDYWAAYGVLSKSNVAAVGDVSVVGNGNIFGLRYIHPLIALTRYSHSLTLGADYKDFQETTVLLGADSFNTPVAYLPFYAGYDGTVRDGNNTTQMNAGLTFSVRGMGNDALEFASKRSQAKPDFAHLRAEFKVIRQLPKEWQLQARFSGQVANEPLISNEQFAIGGADTVRGYPESSALGDKGVLGTLELRTPPLAKSFITQPAELVSLIFFDSGQVRVTDPLPAQTAKFSLSSAGLGIYLKGWGGWTSTLDWAWALRESGQVKKGDNRLHFNLGFSW